MQLSGQKLRLRKTWPRSHPWRVLAILILIAIVASYGWRVRTGAVRSPFAPTLTPTPLSSNLAAEGDEYFRQGQLDQAIQAYQAAVRHDPEKVDHWITLTRFQVYSSTAVTTDEERRARLDAAMTSARRAVNLDPDNSTAHAVLALALDWSGVWARSDAERDQQLNEATAAVVRALQLDPGNPLALAYYAEILTDQQKWSQALDAAEQAVASGPSLMDVHRVYGYVLESNGDYEGAIEAYRRALAIDSKLGFLYLSIGANYRRLGGERRDPELVATAIYNFGQAATLTPQDTVPLLSIAKTYYQLGDYRLAAEYIKDALEIDPTNPDIYGRLGLIYYHNRNYEGSIEELGCAVDGCPKELKNDEATPQTIQITGLALSNSSLEYYYTYASALAGLADPKDAHTLDYCDRAGKLFGQIRAFAAGDATVMAIVDEGEAICRGVEQSLEATATPEN